MIRDLIMANWLMLLIVVLFVIILALLYKSGKKEEVKRIVKSLVIQAEKTLGSGTGELKYVLVVERLYYVMPSLLRFLYTKKEIDDFIIDAVDWLKEYLREGHDLLGYETEILLNCPIEGMNIDGDFKLL